MWENLPSHLRTALGVSLILVVGVAVASFTLSFIALREVAANPLFGWGKNAWIFPLCVDAALVASEVTYIAVSMIRGINRALPFAMIVLFGAVTVWFNIARVPSEWRAVTAIPPLAGIFMTLLIAFMLKVFARVTGKALYYDAPPSAAGMLMPQGSPVRTAVYRTDVPEVETSSGPRSNGSLPRRPARVQALAKSKYGAKRMLVQDYLAKNGTGENPGKVARKLGVSERYVKDIMREQG